MGDGGSSIYFQPFWQRLVIRTFYCGCTLDQPTHFVNDRLVTRVSRLVGAQVFLLVQISTKIIAELRRDTAEGCLRHYFTEENANYGKNTSKKIHIEYRH